MLKRRFFPYIIGACIVVILAVSFIGTRAYQRHVELDAADAQASNGSLIERPHNHSHWHDEDAQNKSFESGVYIDVLPDVLPSEEDDNDDKEYKEILYEFKI